MFVYLFKLKLTETEKPSNVNRKWKLFLFEITHKEVVVQQKESWNKHRGNTLILLSNKLHLVFFRDDIKVPNGFPVVSSCLWSLDFVYCKQNRHWRTAILWYSLSAPYITHIVCFDSKRPTAGAAGPHHNPSFTFSFLLFLSFYLKSLSHTNTSTHPDHNTPTSGDYSNNYE